MNAITFDALPEIVSEMNRKLDLLLEKKTVQPEADFLMTVEELLPYLPEQPARQTLYMWVFERKIPFEKHGKRLYFKKSKIDSWLQNARQMNQ